MAHPKVTLEQWRVLQAVIDTGGFAQAAKTLHRSQSSVSYAVQKLQEQLGTRLLRIVGRKAELTEAGKILLQQSRLLLEKAGELEDMAHMINSGWETEIQLVVDVAYPTRDLIHVLKQFEPLSQGTRVLLKEVVLSGAEEALIQGNADLVITAVMPQGFLGDLLTEIEFIAVAHPEHSLHQMKKELVASDLQQELQVVISDSGVLQQRDVGWQESRYRWSVTRLETAVETISSGLGFAWLPVHMIENQLRRGELQALPLREGQTYKAQLYQVMVNPAQPGPATSQLAKLFLQYEQARQSTQEQLLAHM
ncbi:MAG: LysR family transcriptional regulator [Gammaproteobacteria bacterium]|nr:LysR family transcriptional regulator [Gammaproteobacteria bacterium]